MSGNGDQKALDLAHEIPLLPLKDIVVFPHMIVPVFISEDLCINAVQNARASNGRIFLSAFKVPGEEGEGLSCSTEAPFDVYDVGTICSVMRDRKLPDGRVKVLIQGIQKARLKNLVSAEGFPLVRVAPISDTVVASSSPELEALLRAVEKA